jgi:hypothetical protein
MYFIFWRKNKGNEKKEINVTEKGREEIKKN